jgi:hypothetical protein
MPKQEAATKILEDLVTKIRQYNDLMSRLDDRVREAAELREEASALRLDIEGTVRVVQGLAATVSDEPTRKLFLMLADCFETKAA